MYAYISGYYLLELAIDIGLRRSWRFWWRWPFWFIYLRNDIHLHTSIANSCILTGWQCTHGV